MEQVGELTFPHLQAYVDDIVTVTEDELLDAIRRLARKARLVAEPGGAAAVAAALYRDRRARARLRAADAGRVSRCCPAATSIRPCWPTSSRDQSYTG